MIPDPGDAVLHRVIPRVPTRARWVAAFLLTIYGFAKLNGSQFTVLDSELARPMGQVSGFWLTWYYFSYSTVYGTTIALVQIAGAILLAFRRTALLAALLLVPVLVNILLIDVFFRIDPGATLVALVILACLVGVIAPHVGRLRDATLLETSRYRIWPRILAVGAFMVVAFGVTYWIANDNNRHPTPIDGVWSVVSPTAAGPQNAPWNRVFFEHNRAFLAVFRSIDGRDDERDFEVDPNGAIRVWQRWLSKGALLMAGSVQTDGTVRLHVLAGDGAGEDVVLARSAPERR